MPGPAWDDDAPADAGRIAANVARLVAAIDAEAGARELPGPAEVCDWHRAVYAGCSVPVTGYVGAFRGDPSVPDLADYEIGIGPIQPDLLPETVGVWAADVARELTRLFARMHAGVAALDAALPRGRRPTTVDELDSVVRLVANVHGEWVRVHPFANGNGRTARLWAAWLARRYDLPLFVTLKPRPADVAYARAARASMGRPPDFRGDDHETAYVVSGHLLTLSLLPSARPPI